MRYVYVVAVLLVAGMMAACSSNGDTRSADAAPVGFAPGQDIEAFWMDYADSRGGLTWGSSSEYPEYAKVKEGDTLLIQLDQGPCLMEFFHSRWRRANDVRRWNESVNDYGGCPFVFD